MKDFSLIFPTRKRVKEVYRLFDSIKATASNLENIEVILYIDEDDIESQKISYNGFSIIKLIHPRGETMGKITRTCYTASRGRYIMLLNDDLVFRTSSWDNAVLAAFSQFKDKIALVYGNDLFQGRKMASFPILSKIVCDLMGNICPSEYKRVLIDVHIFDIFKKLHQMGYNRIVYLKDVIFEHLSYDIGKSPEDESYASRNIIYDQQVLIMGEDRRYNIALKLAQYIQKFSQKK